MLKGFALRSIFDLRGWILPPCPLVLPTAEFFSNRLSIPGEEELARFFRRVSEKGVGSPLILTLFDGKAASGNPLPPEIAPRAGEDGFHYWRAFPLVLQRQLRGWLAASFFAKSWILVPNLRRFGEYAFFKEALDEACDSLFQQGAPFDRYAKFGFLLDSLSSLEAMAEVPAYDFLLLDLDRLACQWLGLSSPVQLSSYLPLGGEELNWLRLRLGWIPFAERWVGAVTRYPTAWPDLDHFPFQVLFEARGLES
ncbi:MAG: putative PEP-binding protein [bacterium]